MWVKMFSDGGARGNPGPAAIGVVIKDEKEKILYRLAKTIGETTNNQAEYEALIAGLKYLADQKIDEAVCHLDSELIVKQLNGEYKVKNDEIRMKFQTVQKLRLSFKKIEFIHVKREMNEEADALVNEALDNLTNS